MSAGRATGVARTRAPRLPTTRLLATGAILTGALLPATTAARAGRGVEADPHELYDRARESLAHGDLEAAESALASLSALVAKRPDWDPESVFTKELIPPLKTRLNRLSEAGRRLDEFAATTLQTLRPPDLRKDISTVRDYTDWATSVIQRLRDERDQIITTTLPEPDDQAILAHTASYARTEQLLEVDVLKKMAATAGDDILGLLAGDPQLESVLVRFRQLKRDLMDAVAAKADLEERTKKAQDRDAVLLSLLGAVVTDEPSPEPGPGGRPPAGAADLFPLFLEHRTEAVSRMGKVTPVERALLRADLDRYARYNTMLLAAGVAQDQRPRIAALEKAVDGLPAAEAARDHSSRSEEH